MKYLVESKRISVSFNGKMRLQLICIRFNTSTIEEIIMKDERTIKQLDGRTPNKVIIVGR
jgi:leucyl-tRNA synthetase